MADVQKEKGHVRLANRLDEAITFADFTGVQLKAVRCLIRMTFGWRKKTVAISLPDLAAACNVEYSGGFRRAFDQLIAENVVWQLAPGVGRRAAVYQFNKNFEDWGRFSVAEQALVRFYGSRPPSFDALAAKVPQQGQETDDDFDDDSVPQEGQSTESPSLPPQGHATDERDEPLSAPPETDLCLNRGTKAPSKSLFGETLQRPTDMKDSSYVVGKAPRTRAGIPQHAPEDEGLEPDPRPASIRFVETQPERTRREWRNELASLAMNFGDSIVEQAAADALTADPPITALRVFRIFVAQAKRDSISGIDQAPKPVPTIVRPVVVAAAAEDDRARYAAYEEERRRAGEAWRVDHPDEWRWLMDEARSELGAGYAMPGGQASAERSARSRAADLSGFPPFERWRGT